MNVVRRPDLFCIRCAEGIFGGGLTRQFPFTASDMTFLEDQWNVLIQFSLRVQHSQPATRGTVSERVPGYDEP